MNCILYSLFFYPTFGKLGVNLNGLVVKVLDSQSRNLMVKTVWVAPRSTQSFILLRLIKYQIDYQGLGTRDFCGLSVIK